MVIFKEVHNTFKRMLSIQNITECLIIQVRIIDSYCITGFSFFLL